MNLHTTIVHFERPQMLIELLESIPLRNKVRVYDDGSGNLGQLESETFRYIIDAEIKNCEHHGKRNFWKLWNRIFDELPEADLYLFLPDDVVLLDGFWKEIETLYPGMAGNDPITANLLNDKGRTGRSNWRSGSAKIERFCGLRMLNSNWFDGCGLMNRAAVEVMRKSPIYINASRWKNSKNLGSGVGEQISKTLRENGGKMLQTPRKLMDHIGHESKMNPQERGNSPMDTWELPPIIAGMATIPGREEQCRKAVESVLPYVDELHLAFNGFNTGGSCGFEPHAKVSSLFCNKEVRKGEWVDVGDGGKFIGSECVQFRNMADYYYFTLDDDIIYPPDYVWTLIHKIEQYKRSTAVGVHGKTLPNRTTSFYKGPRKVHHTKTALSRDQVVNCLGTGCLAFHSSTIEFGIKDIEQPNMADIWFALACQRQNVPQIAIERPANWLKVQRLPKGTTIYEQEHERDTRQTKVWNDFGEWELKTKYLKR